MKRINIHKVSLAKSTPMKDIYAEYKSRYNQKAAQINAYYGADMYTAMSPNQDNFEMLLSGMQQKYPKLSMNKLVDKIVDRQSSKLTWASASKLADNPYYIQKARYDASYIYSDINKDYHNLRAEGMTAKGAAYIISNRYFGSQ